MATCADERELAALLRKVARVNRVLREEYGVASRRGKRHPTDSLIATILSQHTADRNSGAAFAALQERYSSWQEIASAPIKELAATIRSAGLANIKARYIKSVLMALQVRYGSMDLTFLRDISMDEAREILRSLPGVGAKTAACVLLFSCDHPALPVDTHVHRVARRLRLIGPQVTAEQAHRELERLVPPKDVYDFHVNLIRHGRRVCLAREPRCGKCVLQADCAYFHSAGEFTGARPTDNGSTVSSGGRRRDVHRPGIGAWQSEAG